MKNTDVALKVEKLSQSFFSSANNEVIALSEVSFCLMPHDFVIVIGPNGSGKSSLLKAIFEGQSIDGRVLLNGVEVNGFPVHERSRFISYMTQSTEDGTISEFSIFENVLLASLKAEKQGATGTDKRNLRDSLIASMKRIRIDLVDRLDFPVNELSGGERQIVATLMKLQGSPSILLCDEPTASVDKSRTLLIGALVSEYVAKRNVSILWVTHDIEQILRLGNRLIALKAGRVACDLGPAGKTRLNRESLLDLIQSD